MATDDLDPRYAVLHDQVRRHDVEGLRNSYGRGELAWLAPVLGRDAYHRLGVGIDAGDLSQVRTELAPTGFSAAEPITQVTTVRSGPGLDPLVPAAEDPTVLVSRAGAVLPAAAVEQERRNLIVIGILVGLLVLGLIAFLIFRNRDDGVDTVAADTSMMVTVPPTTVMDTVAPTSVVDTTMPLAPITTVSTPTVAPLTTAATAVAPAKKA